MSSGLREQKAEASSSSVTQSQSFLFTQQIFSEDLLFPDIKLDPGDTWYKTIIRISSRDQLFTSVIIVNNIVLYN